MKETTVVNFDAIYTEQGDIKILEPGSGFFNVGIFNDWSPKHSQTHERTTEYLFKHYKKIYFVLIGDFDQLKQIVTDFTFHRDILHFRAEFVEENKHRLGFYSLDEFIKIKNELKADALVVPQFHRSGPIPLNLRAILQKNDIHLPVVNSSELWRSFNNKLVMDDMLAKSAPELLPEQAVLNINDQASIESTFNKISAKNFIFKPVDGTRAIGVNLIPRGKYHNFIRCLQLKTELEVLNTVPDLYPFSTKQVGMQFIDLWKALKKSNGFCIVQECLLAKPITHFVKADAQEFRPTIRFFVSATFDTETQEIDLKVTDAYYKLPQEPLNEEQLTWQNTISYNAENKALRDRTAVSRGGVVMVEKIKESSRQARIRINSTSLVLKQINGVAARMQQLFVFLNTTSEVSYMESVFNKKDTYSAYAQAFLYRRFRQNMSVELCRLYHENGISSSNFILSFILSCEIIIEELKIFETTPQLIAIYCALHESKEQLTLEQKSNIVATAATIVEKHVENNFLEKMFSGVELEVVLDMLKLTMCCQFSFTYDMYYKNALKHFKENNFTNAIKQFQKAAVCYLPNNPVLAKTYHSIASCYLKQDDYESALINAKKALDLKSEHADLFSKDSIFATEKKYNQAKALILFSKAKESLDAKCHSDASSAFNEGVHYYDKIKTEGDEQTEKVTFEFENIQQLLSSSLRPLPDSLFSITAKGGQALNVTLRSLPFSL